MEVKFVQNTLHCLRPLSGQVHSGEQTLEIRLPDAYPDMGKILGCWGQVVIRGKEWRGSSMGANGGVMASVLYAPEDGTQPRVVDAWIPIQCRWDLPGNDADGVMHLMTALSGLDARGLSARKMMVRAVVDCVAQGMTRYPVNVAQANEVPEDVQLLKNIYPAQLPMEAGEKQVQLEERFALPENQPVIHKIVRYSLIPVVTEQKILGNRLVFRGQSDFEVMYLTEDGSVHNWKTELPFSQFTELDRDYSPQAAAWISPIVTAMEMELEEGQLHLRGGLAAQYTVFDSEMIEVVEDAFSPYRNVIIKTESVQLPILLDRTEIDLPVESKLHTDAQQILSVNGLVQYPRVTMDENGNDVQINGQFQFLAQTGEGQMTGESARFEAAVPFRSAPENLNFLWLGVPAQPEISTTGDGYAISGNYPVSTQIYSGADIPMVTELELGELREPASDRPSIILRRAGEEGLWNLAKQYGSTVASIQAANQLNGEPEAGTMLLIPVH